jgi:uncharacterized protein YjbJ (UPF0337 family)
VSRLDAQPAILLNPLHPQKPSSPNFFITQLNSTHQLDTTTYTMFRTSPIVRKSPVETVKDAAKVVDRTVSDYAVKGIEKGGMCTTIFHIARHLLMWFTEQVAEVVKEAVPQSAGEAKGQANQMAGEAKGKASELSGEAKGKAQEMKGQAQEMKGEAKGEVKSKVDKM